MAIRLAYLLSLFDTFLKIGSRPNVKSLLSKLLKISISDEDFDSWIEKNSSTSPFLKELIDHNSFFQAIDYDLGKILPFIFSIKENEKIIISKVSTPPDNIKISKSSYLQPEKNIPRLYFFVGKEIVLTDESTGKILDLDKDIAHYGWVINAIRAAVSFYESIEDISSFIRNNKAALNKINSMSSGHLKYLGQGVSGAAFQLTETMVIKIFSSSFQYQKAKEAFERLHKNPELAKTEAMIYDVGIIGQYK